MTEQEHLQSWINIFKAIGEKEMKVIFMAVEIIKEELKNAK
jgi:hypothetical protein